MSPSSRSTVFVIDDDAFVRRSVARWLRSCGFDVVTFASAREFFHCAAFDGSECAIVDVQMPEVDGLELQSRLEEADNPIPIVFLTAHGTIPITVEAMRRGAVDFLTKPVKLEVLLGAVQEALARGRAEHAARDRVAAIEKCFESLTARERQVLAHVVSGSLNKQIAAKLGICEKTVKAHRAQVMRKMRAASLAELVGFADCLGIGPLQSCSAATVPT